MTDPVEWPRGSKSGAGTDSLDASALVGRAHDRQAKQANDAVSQPPESGDSDAPSGDESNDAAADGIDARSRRPWSLLVSAVALVIAAAYLVLALGLPAGDLARPDYGFLPRIVGGVLIGAAGAVGVEALRTWRRDRRDATEPLGSRVHRVFLLLGLLVLYVLVVNILGHVPTASVIAALTIRVAGDRPWWQSVLLGVLLGVASFVLFDLIMGMRLPG